MTVEFDALPLLINPGVQWVSSGVLEWVIRMFCADLVNDSTRYDTMIEKPKPLIRDVKA